MELDEMKQAMAQVIKGTKPDEEIKPLDKEEAGGVKFFPCLMLLERRGKPVEMVEVTAKITERGQWALQMHTIEGSYTFHQETGKSYGKTWRLWNQRPFRNGWRVEPW